ncbi:hypothetical protein BGW41_005901 [Actinomortierella wolfii]|nr:hypothetical protein BGW41_005901 [Actinomortierella wolfii]
MATPSPRRSNRGGHARSKKKEDDDDGGTTRCVCNEQHHEGVMIQCETCKVWQHCPCVGLGDGEVTPDKYYCESCKPQNHPYRVQNGVLMTSNTGNNSNNSNANNANSKRGHAAPAVPPPSLKSKPTKKRNTMNSKEASTPMDLILAQQKWSEGDPLDAIEANSHPNRASKRRRKTESTTDEEDDSKAGDNTPNGMKRENDDSRNHAHASTSPSTSPKSSSNGSFGKSGQSTKHKKSLSTSNSNSHKSTAHSRSSSPVTQNGSSHADTHSQTDADEHTSSGTKNARSASEVASNCQDTDSVVPLTKRRKTKPDSTADDAMSEAPSEKVKKEGNGDSADTPNSSRSRKNGFSRTGSNRRLQVGSDGEDNDGTSSPTDSQAGQTGSPGSSSTATGNGRKSGGQYNHGGKKSARRTTERSSARHHSNNSRHSTPQPHDHNGTPQPWPPVTPAVVRYPSPKMTIQEMTKRAKQLLDYITRMQVDMANEKNRSGCSTPASTPPKNGVMLSSSSSTTATVVPSVTAAVRHPIQHHPGDGQVPDLTRTSMESTVDGHIGDAEVKSADIKNDSNGNSSSGSETFVSLKSAVTSSLPPPPPSADDNTSTTNNNALSTDTSQQPVNPLTGVKLEEVPREKWTSFELMDKLTGDLIRFQEKFGAHI